MNSSEQSLRRLGPVDVVLKELLMSRGALEVFILRRTGLVQLYTHCNIWPHLTPHLLTQEKLGNFRYFLWNFPLRSFFFLTGDLSFLIIKGFVFCKLPSFRYEPERQVRVPESHSKSDLPEFVLLSHAEP